MKKETQEERRARFLENPKRAVWTIAAPTIVGFSAHTLYNIVDRYFVGSLGGEALAAATYVGALFFVAIALTNGLATGVTAAMSQAMGRGESHDADRIASNGLALGIGIGIVFGGVGMIIGPDLVRMLGAEGLTADLAWQYFQIIAAGVPLFFVSTVIRSVLIGEGDAKTPMVILTIGQFVNAFLDWVFIVGLELGIRGAALATIISHSLALAAFLYLALGRGHSFAKFRLGLMLRMKKVVVFSIVSIGLPATFGHLVMAGGMGLTNRLLAHFGQMAVAGYGAGGAVDMVVILPILALATSTVTVLGMFAGAGRADLVRQTTLYCYRWAIIISSVLGAAAYGVAELIVGVFTDNPDALEVGVTYIHYMVFAYPLVAFGLTSGRVLQGLGRGMPTLMITTLRVLLISIPAAYAAVYLFGASIEAVWIAAICGGLASDILAFVWVRKYLWLMDPTELAARGMVG